MEPVSRISLLHQEGALKSYFPASRVTRKGEDELIWVGELTPTPLSRSYQTKLHYKRGEFIRVFVIGEKLKLAEGQNTLPHVYSTPLQQLCLYYPPYNEWHTGMFYVHTLIPWASEWLFHYETWVATGKWRGGGIEHRQEPIVD